VRAGRHDRVIDIEAPVTSAGVYGAPVVSEWSKVLYNYRANRRDVGGRERIDAGQEIAEFDAIYTLRRPPAEITPLMRVKEGLEYFEIKYVVQRGRQGRELELVCRSANRIGGQPSSSSG
jgi:head-tail adaptor